MRASMRRLAAGAVGLLVVAASAGATKLHGRGPDAPTTTVLRPAEVADAVAPTTPETVPSKIDVVVRNRGSHDHRSAIETVFVALLPVAISQGRDAVPAWLSHPFALLGKGAGDAVFLAVDRFVKQPGLEPGIFGLILVLFILFEPLGIYGRWRKIQVYFASFPLYKQATFKRQKTYMRSERLR